MRNLFLVTLTLALVAASCSSSHQVLRAQVVKIELNPVPEGPAIIPAERKCVSGCIPLASIADAIPRVLPKNPHQSCSAGLEVNVTLSSGQVLSYGPCKRPVSIQRVLRAMETARSKGYTRRGWRQTAIARVLMSSTGRSYKMFPPYPGHRRCMIPDPGQGQMTPGTCWSSVGRPAAGSNFHGLVVHLSSCGQRGSFAPTTSEGRSVTSSGSVFLTQGRSHFGAGAVRSLPSKLSS
jgi:hypothetical protein